MPENFKTAVYRISPMYGETLEYRFGGAFSTIGSTHRVLGNDVYFLRYEEENTGKLKTLAKKYVKSVDERIRANKEYMKEELSEETAEGTPSDIALYS